MGYKVTYDAITKYMPPGTVIWRRCYISHTLVEPVPYDKAGIERAAVGASHGFVFKTMLSGGGEFLCEPVVSRLSGLGIVTFLDQPPPRDWTHLVITRRANNGKALFAEHRDSLDMAEYIRFRRDYYRALWQLECDEPERVPAQRLYVARKQHVALPPGQHRGFYCYQPEGVWCCECPLQEDAVENNIIPVTRAREAYRGESLDCLLVSGATP